MVITVRLSLIWRERKSYTVYLLFVEFLYELIILFMEAPGDWNWIGSITFFSRYKTGVRANLHTCLDHLGDSLGVSVQTKNIKRNMSKKKAEYIHT